MLSKLSAKEAAMKALKSMNKGMVLVNFITKMGDTMMGTGAKIKWVGMDHYTISLVSLLIKVNGKMINFTGMENFIMNFLLTSDKKELKVLTIVILIVLMTIG